MKKYILIFATLFCIAFAGCNKDKDKDKDKAESLVGTVWENHHESYEDGNRDYYTTQLHFTTSSDVKITEKYNSFGGYDQVDTAMAKYSYNNPMIIIYENDAWDEQYLILKGDGRLYWPDEDLYFVKK